LTIILVVKLNLPFIAYPWLLVLFMAPLVFERQMRKPFSKKAEVKFDDNYLSITLSNIYSGAHENTDVFNFEDIAEFTTADAMKNDLYSLTLYTRDGSRFKYTFCGEKYSSRVGAEQDEETLKGRKPVTNIEDIFFDYAKVYNRLHPENAIIIHAQYFATRASRSTTITISVFIAIGIAIAAILKPGIIPACLIPVALFYGVVFDSGANYRRQVKRLG